MNDDARGAILDTVKSLGIVPDKADSMARLMGMLDNAKSPNATPSLVLAGARDAAWVASLSVCDEAPGVIDQIREVRGFARVADQLTLAVRRSRIRATGTPEPAVSERLKITFSASGEPKGPENSSRNASIVMALDSRWAGRIRYDAFAMRLELDGEPMTDLDEVRAQHWLDAEYDIQIGPKTTGEAMAVVGHENGFHPVREYLDALRWDGVRRVDSWLIDYCQSPDKKIVRSYAQRFLLSAVARIYDPGCKVDTTLIMQGDQGAKKSTALRALASPRWFSDTAVDLRSKDAMQVMVGVWIYEFAEMDAIRRQDFSITKAFLTSQVDRFRPSYGRNIVERARSGIIAGTTNDEQALPADPTGSRRYWPVQVGAVDAAGLQDARDMLWAEAVAMYRDGQQWWLTDDEERRRVKSEDLFVEVDAWEDAVTAWCVGKGTTTTVEVFTGALEKRPGDLNQGGKLRISRILRALGYTPQQSRAHGRYWAK